MNYIFIVERYNDLDMAAPVIWKASTRDSAAVIIVNVFPRRTSAGDFRLVFLNSQPGVKYVEVRPGRGPWKLIRRFWLEKFYYRYIKKRIHRQHHVDVLDFDFDTIPVDKTQPTVVVVPYPGGHPAVSAALKWASRNEFGRALIMHGVNPHRTQAPVKTSGYGGSDQAGASLDAILINNENTACGYPWASANQLVYAGTPRFTQEWATVYDRILPNNPPDFQAARFVVLFMLSKWHDCHGKAPVLSAIDAAAAIEGAEVVVKPHTRGMKLSDSIPENVVVVDNEAHSRELLKCSDVMVFTRSSIFMEALLLDKPVLCLSYATDVELASDAVKEFEVHNENELVSRLLEVKSGGRTYSPEIRDKCLRYYAGDYDDEHLIDRYVDRLSAAAR